MDLQGWLPLLLSRKEIIISHIGKFYPPYPQCSNEEIVVMDKAGKIYNRKPRMSDKDEILNGELFLIYIHTDNADSIDEEDAETSLNIMTELLSPQQNEKFIQNCMNVYISVNKTNKKPPAEAEGFWFTWICTASLIYQNFY